MPKSRIGTEFKPESGSSSNNLDEVEFCMRIAKEQVPMFRRRSKIADLCLELALKFKEIIKENAHILKRGSQTGGVT